MVVLKCDFKIFIALNVLSGVHEVTFLSGVHEVRGKSIKRVTNIFQFVSGNMLILSNMLKGYMVKESLEPVAL